MVKKTNLNAEVYTRVRSEYELSRASNIKKNIAMLNSLGFVSSVCVYAAVNRKG